MKITAITRQKRGDRYNVFVDDKFAAGVSATVLADSGWRQGDLVTEEDLVRYRDRDEHGKVLYKAYEYLSRRQHSTWELHDKLMRKEYDSWVVDEALDHLKDLGYLDDAEFARRWVSLRGLSRGRNKLRQELLQKRIDSELIDAAVGEHEASSDPAADAEALARKRFERMGDLPWEKAYPRLANYLTSRGYSYEIVKPVLATLKREASAAA